MYVGNCDGKSEVTSLAFEGVREGDVVGFGDGNPEGEEVNEPIGAAVGATVGVEEGGIVK